MFQRFARTCLHGVFIAAVFLFVGSPADATTVTVSTEQLSALARHPQWLRLLHVPRGMQRSEVLSPEFFLAADGAASADAELRATLDAYAAPFEDSPETHARCRFPARYLWLSQQLPLPGYSAREPRCRRLAEWANLDQLRSVSLLLVSGYFGNPASSFGHSLIRFNTDEGRASDGLTDLGVNFGALVPENESTLVYVFKGIFGGYQAGFSDKPYYSHDLIYTHTEFRDIWDHELALDGHEQLLLVYHLWEIVGKKFTYYFAKENCAYRIAEVLALARGEDLLTRSSVWFAPVEVFHRLHEAGSRSGRPWVRAVRFVPSAERLLRHQFEALDPDEADAANALITEGPSDPQGRLAGWPAAKRIEVLDALLGYHQYRIAGEEPTVTDASKQAKNAVLRARLQLPPRDAPVPPMAPLSSPAEGSAPMLTAAGLGHDRPRSTFARLRWAPFSYELSGHNGLPDGELVVLDTVLDVGPRGRSTLDGIDVIRVRKLNANRVRIVGESWLSWDTRIGAHRDLRTGRLRAEGVFGGGYAVPWGVHTTAYACVDAIALTQPATLGAEPNLALVVRLHDWKLWLQAGSRYEGRERHWFPRQHAEATYRVSADRALRLEITREQQTRGVLSLIQYW